MANLKLSKSKIEKNDEFYTRLEDIEKEIVYYKKYFEGKTVFCNCDDPYESNFFKYFANEHCVNGIAFDVVAELVFFHCIKWIN